MKFGHVEQHFTSSETLRDIVIGMSDGLTVPFALAAGLSGAIASTHIIVTAGLAEIAAGSISMGLGGYLAARSPTHWIITTLNAGAKSRKSTRSPKKRLWRSKKFFKPMGSKRRKAKRS